jgi:pimeloyl-ACP methyl ester carboxylesterase
VAPPPARRVPQRDHDEVLDGISTRFAEAYAAALPNSTLQIVKGAGHWPWIDEPSVIDQVLSFVADGR